MVKKKPAARSKAKRNTPKKAAKRAVTVRSTRADYALSAGNIAITLPVIESESGRSLRLRARLGMNRESFARLVPMSTRNLASIEAGKEPSANLLRQLKELRRIVDALGEVIQKDAIGPWLNQPNNAFDGLKPVEVIERGESDRIWEMIFHLRSGVAS